MKNADKFINGLTYNRCAGVLMPLFSLPSKYGIGDMGSTAYKFLDMLKECGQSLWAVLPLGPTGYCNSPYKSQSAFAGNPYFISPEILEQKGLLKAREINEYDFGSNQTDIDYAKLFENRFKLLQKAYVRWTAKEKDKSASFKQFISENRFWLADYSLYMSLKQYFDFKPWNLWPEDIQNYDSAALIKYRRKLRDEIKFWQFVQYEYYQEWQALKSYAESKGIKIIGDMPFYLEYDSADVWSKRQQFAIDEKTHEILLSTGVPGDIFSKFSRNWGMPCYRWDVLAKDKYKWHLKRFEHAAKMYDIIRVDHAIGFIRYYGINERGEKWYEGPDFTHDVLIPKITALMNKKGKELIAEDLGSVPERAYHLFNKYNWSGTRVLQFGFANQYGTETIHLPFYYPHKSVAYTSTHDNQTLNGYIQSLTPENMPYIAYYLHMRQTSPQKLQQKMIEELYRSASEKVIVPMPDILGLDNKARICCGKEYQKSWRWRISSLNVLTDAKRKWLKKMTFAYARTPFSTEEGKKYGWKWE